MKDHVIYHILHDFRLTEFQRILLYDIRSLSMRAEGCNATNSYFIRKMKKDKKTVASGILKLEKIGLIKSEGERHERIIQFVGDEEYMKGYRSCGKNALKKRGKNSPEKGKNSPIARGKNSPDMGEKIPDQGGKIPQSRGKNSPAHIEKEREIKEKEGEVATPKGFSVIKSCHEEIVKFLLAKYRKKLIALLPDGTAEEIAGDFASYWVSQGRGFTNKPHERKGVLNSLEKWADIERPKNEGRELREIFQRKWRKDLTESEMRLVQSKVHGIGREELETLLNYGKCDMGGMHRKNVYSLFGDNFPKHLEHSKI